MLPGLGSVAIDNGNPNDSSDAQNVPVVGTRDIGSTEYCAQTFFTDTVTSCASYYTWIDGYIYTSNNNVATLTITNMAGCDSVITLNLTLHNLATTDTVHACDSIVWIDGQTYYPNHGIVSDTLTNSLGCDSVVFLHFIPSNYGVDIRTVCDSLTWINGVTYYSSNNSALDTLTSYFGCDSVVTLDLLILNSTTATITEIACNSYTSPSGSYVWTSSGIYMDTIPNSVNCDSIIMINLTINNSSTSTITETACNSYISPSGNYVWTSSNTYIDTITNAVNCDSIITINLTILNFSTSTITEIACNSYTSPSGNYVWTSSNTYLDTIPNTVNCDSIITINLTVNSTHSTDVIMSCNPYTWIDGNTYTSSNSTAIYTTTNSLGCDSTVTLNFTRLISTVGTEIVSACGSYTWNGFTYTSSNNTAQDTLVNAAGCDSIVTLNLTILNSTSFTDVITSCNPITWIDGNRYLANNNTATHILVNTVGCDSIVTLDFTLLQSSSDTDVVTSCNPFTWIDGIIYNQTTSGQTFTITNSQGCDSVVTLDFTLLEVDTTVTRNYLTLTAQASNASYQWIDCANGAITGETDASFTATVNGSYQVEITQNGCVDTSACFAITNVGVLETELLGLSLYPNPTSDVLHIDKGNNASLEITITNSAGSIVYQSTSKSQITTVSMVKMATGMYVVTMKNELGMKVEKVVKR